LARITLRLLKTKMS